jgi:hypothetical protein
MPYQQYIIYLLQAEILGVTMTFIILLDLATSNILYSVHLRYFMERQQQLSKLHFIQSQQRISSDGTSLTIYLQVSAVVTGV